ncbi:MAG TPA: tyrosinase family protein [Bryobacteraceae bacterium]|nr:tyrosinase family protein [Bryobacteraceae bacterium]
MGTGGILRRPAVPPPVRIRRDVSKLDANDPILVFFNMAIREMQSRPLRVATSWRYQAAIHDYPINDSTTAVRRNDPRNPDPFANDQDYPLPGDRSTYWRKCQHGSWFFLSWHRMYLHFFEKIVMRIVAGLPNGPTDWALPYWNYSASPSAALLPAPFRNQTLAQPLPVPLPNGTPDTHNYLWVNERTPNANAGQPFLDIDPNAGPDTVVECLKVTPFGIKPPSPLPSFGGPEVVNHPPGTSGSLEQTPHNNVHSRLGGSGGFMSLFSTAPLDPMFWLHHCNIDRLWEGWVQRQKMLGNLNRNPNENVGDATSKTDSKGWLDFAFDFHDATGAPVRMTSRQVLNTRAAPLSYEYEDTSDPFNNAP